jgi:predicted esterase
MRVTREVLAGMELWVATPMEGGAGAPVLLGLHGKNSSPDLLWSRAEGLGSGFIHVLPRGLLGKEGSWSWYERDSPLRTAQITEGRGKLLALVEALRLKHGVGPERMAVWGFSQGGLMSLEVGLAAPSALAATLSFGGKLDDVSSGSPAVMARARGRNFFLLHGTQDGVVPFQRSREAYRALAGNGGLVELAELPIRHEITPVAQAAARGYLMSVLGTKGPTA